MYFAVLGKNIDISLEELHLINPKNIDFITNNLVVFDTSSYHKMRQLAGIVKYGKVVELLTIFDLLKEKKLVGSNSKQLGSYLKSQGIVRRFKILDEIKSDLEIKNKGLELMCFENNIKDSSFVYLVEGFQNIDFFESIDFGKPSSGMKIGMMPTKLAQILLNIGIGLLKSNKDNLTIYDPFVGFGTTGFVANFLTYDFIGSDVNITPIKQNIKRWEESEYKAKDTKFTIFKHDINYPFRKSFLQNVDLIISEGWLGPLVSHKTQSQEIENNIQEINNIYRKFVINTVDYWENITVVFTIPVYKDYDNYVQEYLKDIAKGKDFELEFVEEIYRRKNQFVGRQIVILQK